MKPVKLGAEITADKVRTVEAGGYNLLEGVIKKLDAAVGSKALANDLFGKL